MASSQVAALRASLRGELILPGDPGYDAARRVWNTMIDRRPAMIVRSAGTADVVRAVEYARTTDLVVAVRGGGHSFAGTSVCDDGMVIDLSHMKGIEVDAAARMARAAAGLTLGEFDQATQAVGLATTMGTAPPTGIAGLTLGGGLGWLMGKYGLACDNLLSAEVVTAAGRSITARAGENDDLLWGLRGGGGNFGVVTSFAYRLHPVGPVLGGAVTHPLSRAREVLRFFREYTSTAPDELTAFAGILPLADGPAFCIAACHCGDLAAGEKVLRPLRSFGPPLEDRIRPLPYVEMQALLAPPPLPTSSYARSSFLRELSDGAIDAMVAYADDAPAGICVFFLEHLHGAACRVGQSETAFGHRQAGHNFATLALWLDAADADACMGWIRRFWDAMQPFVGRAAYSNYLGDEGEDRVRGAYGANYPRLAALKGKYDPTNFFRLNQNIRPAA